jgi:hypothetical protein
MYFLKRDTGDGALKSLKQLQFASSDLTPMTVSLRGTAGCFSRDGAVQLRKAMGNLYFRVIQKCFLIWLYSTKHLRIDGHRTFLPAELCSCGCAPSQEFCLSNDGFLPTVKCLAIIAPYCHCLLPLNTD